MNNQREKISELIRLADSGVPEAQKEYGIMLLEGGDGVVRNPKRGFLYLKKATEVDSSKYTSLDVGGICFGDPFANLHLGFVYLGGFKVPDIQFNHERSWTHFKRSADRGVVDTMLMLARSRKQGRPCFEQIYEGQSLVVCRGFDLLIPFAWAYLAQARTVLRDEYAVEIPEWCEGWTHVSQKSGGAKPTQKGRIRQSLQASELVDYYEKLAKDDQLETAREQAEKWNQTIDFEPRDHTVEEILEIHRKKD